MIISETELFKGINFKDMQEIARICCEESYAKNTIIFSLYPEVGLKLIGRLAAVFSKRLSKSYQNLLMVSKQDSIAAYG